MIMVLIVKKQKVVEWKNDMADSKHITIALLGNPNTGSTSLFNKLTGLHKQVAADRYQAEQTQKFSIMTKEQWQVILHLHLTM